MALPLYSWRNEKNPYQLQARFMPTHFHEMSSLLISSYSKVGVFPHKYHRNCMPCQSHPDFFFQGNFLGGSQDWRGIPAIDFDKQGKCLASVTKSGCVTIHDFEVLYTETQRFPLVNADLSDDENKQILHYSVDVKLDVVKWNPLNQHQIICASKGLNRLLAYDVHHRQLHPSVYSTPLDDDDDSISFSDIAFASNDPIIFAADFAGGSVYVWDPRSGKLPCHEIKSYNDDHLTSIQLDVENKIIIAAGMRGYVYAWDIRGGRVSTNNNEVASRWSTSMLGELEDVRGKEYDTSPQISSIRLDPSSPYQLAFYLHRGWSGILDIYKNFHLTHLHRQPLTELYAAQPSWLSTCSIFLTPFDGGIRFLDFYPSYNSPWHVNSKKVNQYNQNDIPSSPQILLKQNEVSQEILSCVAHPSYNAIVAGTKANSLMIISQKRGARRRDN